MLFFPSLLPMGKAIFLMSAHELATLSGSFVLKKLGHPVQCAWSCLTGEVYALCFADTDLVNVFGAYIYSARVPADGCTELTSR